MSLSTIQKRVIPIEYQKLAEAGYLSDELKITDAGRTALFHLALEEFKDELVAKAEEKLKKEAEAKEGKE